MTEPTLVVLLAHAPAEFYQAVLVVAFVVAFVVAAILGDD